MNFMSSKVPTMTCRGASIFVYALQNSIFSTYCLVISSLILLLTVSEYCQVSSTFGKAEGLAGNAFSIILIAEEPVAFHLLAKFKELDGFVLPLSQTNFVPDFMQVKVFAPTTDLLPTFVHFAPALAAAFAGIRGVDRKRESIEKNAISLLFISKAYAEIRLLQEGICPYLTYIQSVVNLRQPPRA
jgi:hypothetical protein